MIDGMAEARVSFHIGAKGMSMGSNPDNILFVFVSRKISKFNFHCSGSKFGCRLSSHLVKKITNL